MHNSMKAMYYIIKDSVIQYKGYCITYLFMLQEKESMGRDLGYIFTDH